MAAFAAVVWIRANDGTFAAAVLGILWALCPTLAACTDQTACTRCTGYAAAGIGVQYAFIIRLIDVIVVDTLQYLALAIRACSRFPACNFGTASSPRGTAVIHSVGGTDIAVEVHAVDTLGCTALIIGTYP